jgi:hypothetical protein
MFPHLPYLFENYALKIAGAVGSEKYVANENSHQAAH